MRRYVAWLIPLSSGCWTGRGDPQMNLSSVYRGFFQAPSTEEGRETYKWEKRGAPFHGFLEAGWMTFGLLIAIRVFDSPDWIKAMIPASGALGMFMNMLTLSLVSRTRYKATVLVAYFSLLTGACMLLAAFAGNIWFYAGFFTLAHMAFQQQAPVMIQVYSSNYKNHERGGLFATKLFILGFSAILFSTIGGRLLDWNLGIYPLLLGLLAASAFANAWTVIHIPSEPLPRPERTNPFTNLNLLKEDKLFAWLLGCWMLMGMGNLMVLPLRVEYLANPLYGFDVTNEQVAMVAFVLPTMLRISSIKLWAFLFDRVHFISWRLSINVCFVIGFFLFFCSHNLWVVATGSMFVGLANGGGNIAWNLWVTKLAPVEKVGAYMSVHSALTGVRGVLAPFLGFYLISVVGPQAVSLFTVSMVVLSSIMFAAVWKSPRFR